MTRTLQLERCIVMFSGGAASAVSAKMAVDEFGKDNVVLLFADTLIEDADLYRFNDDVAEWLGIPITRVADGRTPWEVFFSERMMGSSRVDHCSRILKRDILDLWMEENANPETDAIFIGMDATESHRLAGVQGRLAPFVVRSPLDEAGLWKESVFNILRDAGLRIPRLYEMGFPHNNCGGFCVKAGQGHFKMLLEKLPDLYAEHEAKEGAFRRISKKDVSILRDRTGGKVSPLTMKEFRRRVEDEPQTLDLLEWGGCNCMTPPEVE